VITVHGKGGHGGQPHETIDPVVTAAFIVCQLQTIISREINPLATGVISIGKIISGSASNIIPDTAVIEGTLRTLDHEVRDHISESIGRIAESIAKAHRCSVTCEILNGYPPTVNTTSFVRRATALAGEIVGEDMVKEISPTMGAEDMGFFLERLPGCYIFLGTGNESKGLVYPHHSSKFNIDDSVLEIGVTYLAYLALDFLRDASMYE
jgi:amidohydrolase